MYTWEYCFSHISNNFHFIALQLINDNGKTLILVSIFQYKKKEWAQTVITVKNTKPSRLPIVDVAMKDIGRRGEKFKLEIGPVCYS